MIERGAQREDVAAAVNEVGIESLFVGHVVRSSDTELRRGDVGIVVEPLGEAEIGQLGDALGMQEDIVRLHVAVDVLARMEERQCVGDIDADLYCDTDRESRFTREDGLGGRAIDEFKDQVVLARDRIESRPDSAHEIAVDEEAAQPGLAIEASDKLSRM